jgi:hypothetical protein
MEWLTWQGIRALADAEVAKDKHHVRFVLPNDPLRCSVPIQPGAILYARDSWRAPWRTALSKVSTPVVLVTSFNDAHVQDHARELLSGNIQHWFAVQVATTHPKLTAMPIGIDGRDLPTLRAAMSRPWNERDILCLANFQERNPERKALIKWCREQDWISTERWWRGPGRPLSMAEYYTQLGRAKFVLSPPGRGWDCYRTYEALAMGAIPIVRRQEPLNQVVAGLPVLVVDDWTTLTPERLVKPDGTLERITQAYWDERILSYGTHLKSAQ